ncbi:MAG: hypothetical protein SFU99_14280 [Saprospiraceae bacterium]|nr:hypothetical protein [Saprospiraceae bacterium]
MKVKRPYILIQVLILIPIAGIMLFLILYMIATFYYPGGSDVNKTAQGFSWVHNYWCDLMAKGAKNGQLNPARPIAIAAMTVLCLALSVFWWLLPRLLDNGRHHYKIVQSSGIISMILAVFIFTNYHDLIISAAVVFGVIALTGIYIALYRSKSYKTLTFGIFCLILIALNAYIYYTNHLILILPLLQKITFLLYLFWIIFINLKLFFKIRSM